MTERDDSNAREPVAYEKAGIAVGRGVVTGTESVERGLNDTRLAVLGILVSISLTVGFGVPCALWVRVVAGLASFAGACFLIRWSRSRQYLMRYMHWLTVQ